MLQVLRTGRCQQGAGRFACSREAFAADHPQAQAPLQGWRRVNEKNRFANWAELKAAFNAVDKVNGLAVFDIGGIKYRLMAYIRFEKQILYIKAVLTHREYDKGAWKS